MHGLQHINDVLSTTPIAGRYWVWSGLLLGWAREGTVLRHDCRDADFACLDEDWPLLLDSVPTVIGHGFEPLLRFHNNSGVVTQLTFRRQGVNFDFLRFWVEDGWFTYSEYFDFWNPNRSPVQLDSRLPRQDLAPFSFLSRSWLKVRDHERELEALYGDWRVPRVDWRGEHDSPAIVRRRPWSNADPAWDGDLSES